MCNSQHIHSYNHQKGGKNYIFGPNMCMDRSLRVPDNGEGEGNKKQKKMLKDK